MYPQQVLESCYPVKYTSIHFIPAKIAHILGAHSSQLPCFLLYTFSRREIPSSINTRTLEKMTCISVWVKISKVMPQNAPLSIFSLGKGREYFCLKPYEKLSVQVRFLTCSPAHTKLEKASTMHLKIAQNEHFT